MALPDTMNFQFTNMLLQMWEQCNYYFECPEYPDSYILVFKIEMHKVYLNDFANKKGIDIIMFQSQPECKLCYID